MQASCGNAHNINIFERENDMVSGVGGLRGIILKCGNTNLTIHCPTPNYQVVEKFDDS
jgi:hypothetical protein